MSWAAGWLPWRVAMEQALYGAAGFYRVESPSDHFRTSVHTSALFATAVSQLVSWVHERLDGEHGTTVVDVGAGRGELLGALADLLPDDVALVGVDLRPRPHALPNRVDWRADLPARVHGLVFANEWLDNVPLDVAEVDAAGVARVVLVEPATGAERLGPPVSGPDVEWLRLHWPLDGAPEGSRAEIGSSRDAAWVRAVGTLDTGLAIAADYQHVRGARPPGGSLTAFRSGRQTRPVPDGSCDLTAHVALDACADAVGRVAGDRVTTSLRTQRDTLRLLGVRGDVPPHGLAISDPAGYLRLLAGASEAAALVDPSGLGAFGWLAHAKGMPLPPALGGG